MQTSLLTLFVTESQKYADNGDIWHAGIAIRNAMLCRNVPVLIKRELQSILAAMEKEKGSL